MTEPRAAVIIPHYNDHDRLARCLTVLRRQLTPGIEVVIVDNDSPATPQVPPPFRLVIELQRGAANARNRGVIETTAPRLFFLDSDCVPAPDWLETALRVAARSDIMGGSLSLFDETPGPRSGAQAFEAVFAFDNRRYIEDMGFSVTANMLTSRRIFEAVGPFRAGVSEDLEWCRRAHATGFVVAYAEELHVGHPSRRDWPALRQKWERLTTELFGVCGPSPSARLRWAARATAMPLSIAAHLPRILGSRTLSPGERLRAAGTLIRLRVLRARWMFAQALWGGDKNTKRSVLRPKRESS